ncbi:MAG: hypothetical protein CML05_03220 [Pseudozobellia sp.]|nr:hypothetical protein [Pseudozobellia sp.]|tara:strand:+ start:460 stop:1254 length:795 start_codon:yes stop_codon:yes gene_type:complete
MYENIEGKNQIKYLLAMDKETLLYQYFSNQLTSEEQEAFDELLKNDREFKEQYDFEKNLQKVIQEEKSTELKEKLQLFESEIKDEKVVQLEPESRFSVYRKWMVAASIALLIGLGYLGYNSFSGPNYNQLYEDNFQNYPNTVFEISRGESVESIERNAFSQYELDNYAEAIANFEKIPLADRNGYIDFYMGMSYLNLKQYNKAQEFLKKAAESETQLKAEAYWYLAMVALKTKDKQKALQWLEILVDKYDYKKERAKELIDALN